MTWKLKRTAQCDKCPWRVGVNPHDIPGGYDEDKHKALKDTIAQPDDIGEAMAILSGRQPLRIMACHETGSAHCVGWLAHQLGPGNNIGLRIQMMSCENRGKIRLRGEQHQCFEDTLPKENRDGHPA
jgi:hypothetical protein